MDILNSSEATTAVIGVTVALFSAGAALTSAWFARMQFRGRLVIFWRPREAGFVTIDVIVRNVGGGSVRNVGITSSESNFRAMEFEELPSGIEYCIDTLSGRSDAQEYYTTYGWKRRLRWPTKRWRHRSWEVRRRTDPRSNSTEKDCRDVGERRKRSKGFTRSTEHRKQGGYFSTERGSMGATFWSIGGTFTG